MATKILIGSVLKPVDDVRHYHKIARSLSKMNVEIHIFGYPSDSKSEESNIIFHPTSTFSRISLTRIFIGIKFFLLGLKLRPKYVITCTHELLKSSFHIKLFTGAKVIYDVQENYYRNIIYTNSFPWILRYPIARVVRMNEVISSIMISHYFLAERCYLEELGFMNEKNSTILENKFVAEELQVRNVLSSVSPPVGSFKYSTFLITGTIGKHYGIEEGVDFFKGINKLNPESKLNITGVCRDRSMISKINHSDIDLNVSSKPKPYAEILKTIENGGVALLPYHYNKSTEHRIPTKFYEYLYYRIPMIVQKNPVWEKFLEPYNAAIFIDFKNYSTVEVLDQLESFDFYSGKEPGDEILWKKEEVKMIEILKNI